jgi:hypothetical protein
MTERLTCHIAVARNDDLPGDVHPFWGEIDALSEKLAASLKARGVAPDTFSQAAGNGSQVTISTDTPSGTLYFWIELPSEPTVCAQWVALCLEHLTRARTAYQDADWDVCIGASPVAWFDGKFQDDAGAFR